MAVRIKQSLSIYIIGVLVVMTSFAGYLYMPEKAEAAFTFVNSGENGSSASNTSLQATVTGVHAGDLVVILAKWENGDTTVSASDGTSSFTDALSGNHAVGTAGAGEPNVTALYLLSSVTSGSVTYTVTWGAARPWKDVIVAVYTPGSGTLSLDGTANKNVGAGTSLTTGNITTSGTDGIAFALYGEYGTGLDSEKINGLVADRTIVGGVVNQSEIWIKSYTSGFTGQGTATLNSSNNWAAAILAFKLTASGGGGGSSNPHIKSRGGGAPATPNNPFVKIRGGSSGGGGSGTISFDTSSGNTQTTGSSLTWQHTVAAGGVLFVSCSSLGDPATVTGVTYNGVAMTQLWNTDLSGSGVQAQSSGWLMVNPATGSAHDIVCTLSGTSGGYIAGAATSWTGVETSSVAAAHRTVFTRGDGDGSPAITITDSQNGDVIVAGIGNWGTNPVPADTPRVTQNNVSGGAYDHNHESLAATGANAVIDYTGSQFYTMGATALVPSTATIPGNVKFR